MPDRSATKRAASRPLGLRAPSGWTTEPDCVHLDLVGTLQRLREAWELSRERATSAAGKDEAAQQLTLIANCERQANEAWRAGDERTPALLRQLLGERRWWWSKGMPEGRRVAIVSSRLPRRLDPHGTWLQGLRAALRHLREHDFTLVVGTGTAGAELILRGARRVGVRTVLLRCCTSCQEEDWAAQWKSRSSLSPQQDLVEGWALPDSESAATSESCTDDELWRIPERDRAVMGWADDVIVLGVRARGNLEKLLRRRFAKSPGTVLLAELCGLRPPRLQANLIEAGAVPWFPGELGANEGDEESAARGERITLEPLATTPSRVFERLTLDAVSSSGNWDFLTHATRACEGPWPGQTREEYLDELFDGNISADHSPLAALLRIVAARRLHASGLAIRGKYPVVSFTAVPLNELPTLRVFRAHRGRWDFEPYGICIRRSWLESRGARPVIYEDEPAWQKLPEVERPFFQLRLGKGHRSKSGNGGAQVDWSVEREWRHRGDLELSQLSREDGFVFVPTEEDAAVLAAKSPWPVLVLGSEISRMIS